ncbi:hypothetical protein DV515_00002984 [Chloebia gouldiae]|uniref:Uncharacterized protein n=1 Tax=Chloebia gouldiae TaxID=44316 RepID=A0A3L8SU18_CHLGU|nr:hypothetical protein DV515_00002984 [Chloebia gouldiae]
MQKQIPLRTYPKHFALDINRELIQFGFEIHHKRRKIIPVVHKPAPCLVPSAAPVTQQGRREKPRREKRRRAAAPSRRSPATTPGSRQRPGSARQWLFQLGLGREEERTAEARPGHGLTIEPKALQAH